MIDADVDVGINKTETLSDDSLHSVWSSTS